MVQPNEAKLNGVGARAGRPRSAAAQRAILQSAGELLLDAGMGGFTIEGVAARAGVSRVTIYKWWPSRGALALDGFLFVVQDVIAFPDTGNTRIDLTTQVASLLRVLRETPAGKVLVGLLAEAQGDATIAQAFRDRWLNPRRTLASEVLKRGQRRGEIVDDIDLAVVIDQIYGPLYHRLLVGHEPLTDELPSTLVNNVLDGISCDHSKALDLNSLGDR